jgi:hypothetical protein
MSGCRRRSRATSAGSAHPATPPARWCQGALATATAADPQLLLTIYPQQLLVVGRHALPRQQIVKTSIAKPAAPPPVRAAAVVTGHRQAATTDTGPLCGSRRSDCAPGARSARDAHGHGRPCPASRRALPFFLSQILQHDVVEHRLGQQLLQPGILLFKRPQATGIGYLQPAILRLPLVNVAELMVVSRLVV